jgi:hypothetical protein
MHTEKTCKLGTKLRDNRPSSPLAPTHVMKELVPYYKKVDKENINEENEEDMNKPRISQETRIVRYINQQNAVRTSYGKEEGITETEFLFL